MINVLLVTPSLEIPGGVSEFNKILLKRSNAHIKLFILSSAGRNYSLVIKSIFFVYDILRFLIFLNIGSIQIVHLGPSLAKNAIKRDGIFCRLTKVFNKKVFIHWHGWNPSNEFLFAPPHLDFLQKTLFHADHIKFLSSTFESKFVEKGFRNKTSTGNTCIDDGLLQHFSLNPQINYPVNILFLSNISKNKGIYIGIEAFQILASKRDDIKLTIAGEGPELENVKKHVAVSLLDRIDFKGYVTGIDKIQIYKQADIYLFPSYYEGMPTSVIEAMGFGIPIICSSAGAIPDFFLDGKMGYMMKNMDTNSYVEGLEILINNPALRISMGKFNHNFVIANFLSSNTIEKIDQVYRSLL